MEMALDLLAVRSMHLSGRHCDLDEGYWYGRPWVRSTRVNDIVDLVAEFFNDI